MKGIILAGGTGSRLWPITRTVSKQLLPVYDKPMIYYPISTLMLAGIREILIITTPQEEWQFKQLLGDGSQLGVSFSFATQSEPKGLAEAFTIGESFLAQESCLMILGDNIFHGAGLGREIVRELPNSGAHIFTYEVTNPSDYGVLEITSEGTPLRVTEKPKEFISNLAITGLYFFDAEVSKAARDIQPSARGELEITSLIEHYLNAKKLTVTQLSRGTAWLDTGNPNALNDAANYIRVIEERTGLKIGCIEEVAIKNNWADIPQLIKKFEFPTNDYSRYVLKLADELRP